MSIFQRSVTCGFFQELYSHIDKNWGGKFKDMFLVKIASKGTSLRQQQKYKEPACLELVLRKKIENEVDTTHTNSTSQVIPRNDQNTSSTNQKTARSKLERTS